MIRKIPEQAIFGLTTPAFLPDKERLTLGIKNLQEAGHRVTGDMPTHTTHLYFCKTDQQRADEVNKLFQDPDVDAILCARGGWGSLRILGRLDYELISNNPKLLIGYSDITSIQLAIWHKCKIPSLSGPMLAAGFDRPLPEFTARHFWGQIYNRQPGYALHLDFPKMELWRPGQANGIILGGCLSMIVHQLGTPFSPDYTGAILFIEDIGDEPYKIDRNLAQLEQTGILKSINGLIIGKFLKSDPSNGITVRRILEDYFKNRPYPVIYNFPYGHQPVSFPMPIGVPVVIDGIGKRCVFGNLFN